MCHASSHRTCDISCRMMPITALRERFRPQTLSRWVTFSAFIYFSSGYRLEISHSSDRSSTDHESHLQIDHLQIDQIDQIDDLVSHLPLWEVVQDLYSTDLTQGTCATAVDHAGYTTLTRQHKLDHTYQGYIYLPWKTYDRSWSVDDL